MVSIMGASDIDASIMGASDIDASLMRSTSDLSKSATPSCNLYSFDISTEKTITIKRIGKYLVINY